MRYLVLVVAVFAVGCTPSAGLSPSALPTQQVLRSCADFPPGQFPAGNPGNSEENSAPGNSSTNDHDCKN
jgi:hypothetical protein